MKGTQVSRQVDITLNDLDKYPTFMKTLMDSKISRTVNTNLSIKNIKEILDKAQIRAVENARSRAQSLASALNKNVGDVHSISEFKSRTDFPFQLTPGMRAEKNLSRGADMVLMSASAQEPFEPGLMQVSATVYVVFLLK